MASAEVPIINKLGLHARASAKLTQLASKFACEIWLTRSGRRVNAKSIMGVMMLAAGKGSTVLIEANGASQRQGLLAEADAHSARVVGEAEAAAEAARVGAYAGVDPQVLATIAVRELAGHLPSIGSLTITPDLVTGVLAGLVGPKQA